MFGNTESHSFFLELKQSFFKTNWQIVDRIPLCEVILVIKRTQVFIVRVILTQRHYNILEVIDKIWDELEVYFVSLVLFINAAFGLHN